MKNFLFAHQSIQTIEISNSEMLRSIDSTLILGMSLERTYWLRKSRLEGATEHGPLEGRVGDDDGSRKGGAAGLGRERRVAARPAFQSRVSVVARRGSR